MPREMKSTGRLNGRVDVVTGTSGDCKMRSELILLSLDA